jgi:protein subunit release factor B
MNNPITIPDSDEELLKECDVNTFRSGGKGGQHLNKTESAVRLTHMITGIVVTCQNGRSQYKNKRQCLTQLRKKLEKLNYQDPVRIPTKKPIKERERILENKKKHSIKKQLRQKPKMED